MPALNVKLAIDLTNKDKSPGLDGLPIEFYQTFWDHLRPMLTALLNDIYRSGLILTAQQRKSLITLIYKREDPSFLDNWQPISLLCVDFYATLQSPIHATKRSTARNHRPGSDVRNSGQADLRKCYTSTRRLISFGKFICTRRRRVT